MNSSISSILLKEKQIEEEISKYFTKVESKINKFKLEKEKEKKEFTNFLEEKFTKDMTEFESEVDEKCEKIIQNTISNAKKINFDKHFERIVEKLNTEFKIKSDINSSKSVSKKGGLKK